MTVIRCPMARTHMYLRFTCYTCKRDMSDFIYKHDPGECTNGMEVLHFL